MSSIPTSRPQGSSRATTALLWTAQIMLAALFLFAGGVKQVMPLDALAQQSGLPGVFMRFIGVAEILGGLGLVLPGLLRIKRGLTPLAAWGLVIIMVGATITSVVRLGVGAGVVPLAVGIMLVLVARGRRSWVGGAHAATTFAHGRCPAES